MTTVPEAQSSPMPPTNDPQSTPLAANASPGWSAQVQPSGTLNGTPAGGSDLSELAMLITEMRADRLERRQELEKSEARTQRLEEWLVSLQGGGGRPSVQGFDGRPSSSSRTTCCYSPQVSPKYHGDHGTVSIDGGCFMCGRMDVLGDWTV